MVNTGAVMSFLYFVTGTLIFAFGLAANNDIAFSIGLGSIALVFLVNAMDVLKLNKISKAVGFLVLASTLIFLLIIFDEKTWWYSFLAALVGLSLYWVDGKTNRQVTKSVGQKNIVQ